MKLLEAAKQLQEKMVTYRRFIHQNAEIDNDLPITVNYVKDQLTKLGIEVKDLGKSGLVAQIKGDKSGKSLLLRADMDALPIKEETELSFKSINGNMHACGHDLHTAMLLGAVELLQSRKEELSGTIKIMFQPAEETLKGAKDMIQSGLLDNPVIDAALMIHVFALNNVSSGKAIFLRDKSASASCDAFNIHIKGKGGHGAMPQQTIDPLVAMSHIHLGLMSINAREINPDAFLVITPCMLQGGFAANIIPDTALIKGTIRTFDPAVRNYAKKRLEELAISIGTSYRCEIEVDYYQECPSIDNNPNLNKNLKKYTLELLGSDHIIDGEDISDFSGGKIHGSEDFSFISELVPSSIIILSANQTDSRGDSYPQHHPKVLFDESVMPIGAAIYAHSAISWLNDQDQ